MAKKNEIQGIEIMRGFSELKNFSQTEYIPYLKIFSLIAGYNDYGHAENDETLEIEIGEYIKEKKDIPLGYKQNLINNEIYNWIDFDFYKQGFFLRFYIPCDLSEIFKKQRGIQSDYYDQNGYEEHNIKEKWFVDPITNEKITSHKAYDKFIKNNKYFELFNKFCIYNMTRLGYNR
jgi:hypothetical protein